MVLFLIVSNGERPLLTAHNSKIMTCHLHCSLVLDFIVFDGYVAVAAAAPSLQPVACCSSRVCSQPSRSSQPVEPSSQTCLSIQTKNNEKLFNKNYFAWTTRQKILSSAQLVRAFSPANTRRQPRLIGRRSGNHGPCQQPATSYQLADTRYELPVELPLAVAGNLNAPN